ncbi:MAG: pyridoxine 5'-phosphate synthase [Omnitrophica bacterium GWA2_52_8]|nr:MAG: pyridoxine 5'-phosphate synthase [Omnitrophica bacterium GWA2_52_8]
MKKIIRLGVNIDHVATLRQARGGYMPDTVRAAEAAVRGGADGITVHLREDRRHIQDRDVVRLLKAVSVPLNLEMALSPSIIRIALRLRPAYVCLVPEKRQELTTEGGLDVKTGKKNVQKIVPQFQKRKINVSLFLDPDEEAIRIAGAAGADAVEIHTGAYANSTGSKKKREVARIRKAARLIRSLGMQVHAGHGLDYDNVAAVASIPEIEELNIGHAIVSRAVFTGLEPAVCEMKSLMVRVRRA